MKCMTDLKRKTVVLSNREIKAILIKLLKDECAINKNSNFNSMQLDDNDLLYRIDVWKCDGVPDEVVFNFLREKDEDVNQITC